MLRCLFIRWLTWNFAHLATCVCECAHMRPCVLHVCVCVKSVSVGGWGWGGIQVRLCGYSCNRGNSVPDWAHFQTTLSVVALNVSGQIFLQPSAVSTERTFLTGFIVFERFFSSKLNTSTSFQRPCSIRNRSPATAEMPSLAKSSCRGVNYFDNELFACAWENWIENGKKKRLEILNGCSFNCERWEDASD